MKGIATHFSILDWRLYSPCGLKESDMTEKLSLSYKMMYQIMLGILSMHNILIQCLTCSDHPFPHEFM